LLLICFLAATKMSAQEVRLQESLADPALAGWERHISQGNSLTVEEGKLLLRARAHTFAHISRPLEAGSFAVVTDIETLSGEQGFSWCPSLIVYWDVDDWAQIGIDHWHRIHATWMVRGWYGERCDQGAGPGGATGVRIEVAKECVRFFFRPPGGQWKRYAVRLRTRPWQEPPSRLIIGKAFSNTRLGAPRPDGDNDQASPGEFGEARLGPIGIGGLSPERDRLTARDQQIIAAEMRDAEAERILSQRSEPSFDSVAALYPGMRHNRVSTGVPEHADDIIVFGDGRVQLGKLALSFLVGGERFGARSEEMKRTLAEGWMPIHTAAYRAGDLLYRETVFGMSEGGRADKPLTAYLRLEVENLTRRSVATEVGLRSEPEGGGPEPVRFTLAPGARGEAHYACAFRGGAPRPVSRARFEARLEAAKGRWRSWLAPAAVIQVPEKRVTDAYKAWLAYNSLNVDLADGLYCPRDGCGFYEETYGNSTPLYIEALDMFGCHEAAARYLDTLIAWQKPEGELRGCYSSFFEHGMILNAFCEHYLLSHDESWLRRAAPSIEAAAGFIVTQRHKTLEKEMRARGDVIPGLMPPARPYCDYFLPTVSLLTDAWCCVALEKAGRLLEAAGRSEAARLISADARSYRRQVRKTAQKAITTLRGLPALEIEPLTGRLLEESEGMARDYYSICASMLLESGFFPPDDEIGVILTDFLQKAGGLSAGVVRFGAGIDHAYSTGYLLTMLGRNELRRVLLGFYSFLAYGMTRDTYAGVEVTNFRTGDNHPTLPDSLSGSEQLRLLRYLLVDDREGELRLLPGIPRAWLDSPAGIRVERIRTHFGEVSLDVRRKGNSIAADIRVQARQKGRRILLRLPPPRGRLRSARVNGRAAAIIGDSVVLPWAERLAVTASWG
jgi:hypothetical protein